MVNETQLERINEIVALIEDAEKDIKDCEEIIITLKKMSNWAKEDIQGWEEEIHQIELEELI